MIPNCEGCKYFKNTYGKTCECHCRNKEGKAGLNFGFLYFDLADECPDYSPIASQK